MALAFGNLTTSNQNPASNSQTLAVNCSSGTDRGLFVVITMTNTVNFASATYNGVAMTLVSSRQYSGLSQRQAAYYLANPATGTNNLVINFTGNQWNPTSIMAQSFTGVDTTAGVEASNGASTTPHSRSLTISNNSVIYATGISNNAQSFNYDIGGSSRTASFNGHNVNKIVEGAWSATGLSAGAQNVTTKADFGTITNNRFEIKEAVASPPAGRRRIIVVS